MTVSTEAVGWAGLACVYLASYGATIVLPGSVAPGYCIDPSTGKPQLYRLNGFASLCVLTSLFAVLVSVGVVPGDFFHVHFWSCLRASCCLGLVLSTMFYLRGRTMLRSGAIDRRPRCPTADAPEGGPKSDTTEFDARSALEHWYCGLSEYNPRGVGGVDIKMWLYLVGAVQLQLNLMSAVFAATGGRASALLASPGLLATFGCLSFFVFEYCWHELVHTFTYDLFRERVGGKLIWGCTCFYPFFYAVGAYPFTQPECAAAAARLSPDAAGACVVLFFVGWVLTRGANLQKHACKLGQTSFAFGIVPMETLPGSKGRLLVSGFWGVSRHINYAGEILQAIALALPALLACGSLLPLAYPAYYVALFVPRAIDDDRQCRAKYGDGLWGAYTARVPYYILPGVW